MFRKKKFMNNLLTGLMVISIIIVVGIIAWHSVSGRSKGVNKEEFLFDTKCSITAYKVRGSKEIDQAFSAIKEIHTLTNYYDKNSDISKINSAPAGTEVTIDSRTAQILKTALEICKASNGAFDITIAPVVDLWDFNAKNPLVPADEEITAVLPYVDYRNIKLNGNKVVKLQDYTKIDLSGAAKGYAADVAVKVLREQGVKGGIVDLGGNVICFGDNEESGDKMFSIGIQVPFSEGGAYSKVVKVKDRAVVTSGTYERYYEIAGVKYHHILDTKTGHPSAQEYNSVSIVGKNSLQADCLSTACFVLGKEKAEALAKKYGVEIYFEK